ncbi:branched-chain-amino-acid aminotransferase-like protein 1 [Gigaspora margarita]|nr:branched-chain-amino-acid aminotransferase-like protein 1 [Gigaspora margarita]
MSEQKPIVLWTHFRSVSHAFQRTFLQRPQEFHIIDGPFLEFVIDTHDQHLKAVKTGIADPSKSPDPNLFMPKILSIFGKIWKPYYDESSNKPKRMFCKEHSNFFLKAISGTSLLSNPQFLELTHTFLIRNPEKSLRSLYKAVNFIFKKNPEYFIPDFDKNLAGLKESKQIFDLIKDLNKQPIVVDADDLIDDPERVLKKYCELIGEEFKEEMIHWEAKNINEWNGNNFTITKLMVYNAENSTGFNEFTKKYEPEIEYPQIVYDAIAENKPYYDYLYQFKI